MRHLALALLLAGCPSKPQKTTKIGVVVSLSGDCASGVDELVDAAGFAVEEINAAGGVLGAKLELVTRDDQSDGDVAHDVAHALIESDAPVAIVGGACSRITLPMSEAAIEGKVPVISPLSTSPLITRLPDEGYVFRTAPSDALQGKLIAKRARARGLTTLSILHDGNGDAYGEGLRDEIAKEFTAAGGTVINKVALPAAVTDANEVWQTLLAPGRPQAVAMITFPANAGALLEAFGKGFAAGTPIAFYFPDALKDSDFQNQLRSVAPNFVITADNNELTALGAPTDETYTAFGARFEARFGKKPDLGTGSPQAYDAVHLIALGLQAAGVAEGPALRESLTKVSKGGSSYTAAQVKSALAAAAAGEDVDYAGVTGACDFDENGDVIGVYDVWRVKASPRADFELVEGAVSP